MIQATPAIRTAPASPATQTQPAGPVPVVATVGVVSTLVTAVSALELVVPGAGDGWVGTLRSADDATGGGAVAAPVEPAAAVGVGGV